LRTILIYLYTRGLHASSRWLRIYFIKTTDKDIHDIWYWLPWFCSTRLCCGGDVRSV